MEVELTASWINYIFSRPSRDGGAELAWKERRFLLIHSMGIKVMP
jgi:hypothetical protein